MGLGNLDQASLLREMMKKKKKEKEYKIPFAILSLSNLIKEEDITDKLIETIEEKNKNKIYRIKNIQNSEKIIVETEKKTHLNIEKIIKEDENIQKEMIKIMENKEKDNEQIVIEAGLGVGYSTVNATLLVEELIILMDSTKDSEEELEKYLKIINNLEKKQRIGILVEKTEGIENKINKIQEKVWDEFNYYIEVIGIFEEKEKIQFEELNLSRYEKENTEDEKISISLKNRFF